MPIAPHRAPRQPARSAPVPPLVSRLLHEGPAQLSDAELLAVLFREGPRGSPLPQTACQLIETHHGQLRSIAGHMPSPKALTDNCAEPNPLARSTQTRDAWRRALLQAAVEFSRRSLRESLRERTLIGSPADLRDFLALWLRERQRECFAVLFLDSQNRLISAEEMFLGGIAQTVVYPREIARRALETGACSIIVAHNHPSGVTEPSAADRRLTQALREALRLLDLPILDHFIIADNSCFSFAEAGLL